MKKLLNMIDRRHPLFAVTQVTRKVQDKHVHLMTAKASTLKIKQNMIERDNRCLPRRKSRARGLPKTFLS